MSKSALLMGILFLSLFSHTVFAKGTSINCEYRSEDGEKSFLNFSEVEGHYFIRAGEFANGGRGGFELKFDAQRSHLKYLPIARIEAVSENFGRVILELREAKVKWVSPGLPFEGIGYLTIKNKSGTQEFNRISCKGLID